MKKRFNILLLLLLSAMYLPFRRSAKKTILSPKIFAIINPTGNIGDMVFTTPIFRAIKETHPTSRVIVIGSGKNETMLEGNSYVDRYISTKLPLAKIIRELQNEKVDIGISINLGATDLATLFLGGCTAISCFTLEDTIGRETISYRFLSKLMYRTPYYAGMYAADQYLKLLDPFGIHRSGVPKSLSFSSNDIKEVDEVLKESNVSGSKPFVAIAPGAGTKVKQWPARRFGELANILVGEYGINIMFIGGPGDADEIDEAISALDPLVPFVDLSKISLGGLKAALSKVAMIVGNDSGPIYVAEAFGASTVVIIGPTDEGEHPLQDNLHAVVLPKLENRGPQLQSHIAGENDIDHGAARAQIESIETGDVVVVVKQILDKIL